MKNISLDLILSIIAGIFACVQTGLGIYIVTLINQYSSISVDIIKLVIIAIICFNLFIDVLTILCVYTKKKALVIVSIIISLVIIGGEIYGSNILKKVDEAVKEIIVEEVSKEKYSMAFVTYDNDDINDLSDIKNKTKLGYIDNEAFVEGNKIALEVIEDEKLDVELVPFDTYTDLILGLFKEKCEVAALPANYYEMYSVDDDFADYLEETKTIYEIEKEYETQNLSTNNIDVTNEAFTVLFIGVDEQRSDALILASFNPKKMTVTMTSIARDSYVPITCYKNQSSDKITHARVINRNCTINTVEQLMGVDIDFFVEVNFYAVVDIVDALGGLYLYNEERFVGQAPGYNNDRGLFNVLVPEGWTVMDGEQVLAFARERHAYSDGDFMRQQHQRNIIQALATKMLELRDVSSFLKVLEAAGTNISTNFTVDQMTKLFNMALDTMNNTYLGRSSGTNVFSIQSNRLIGYASYSYSDSFQLPLWIYKLYNGSVTDSSNMIKRNLGLNVELQEEYNVEYDTRWEYYYVPATKDWYDEEQVHEIIPPIVLNFVKQKFTLSQVMAWADYCKVKVEVEYVSAGDPLFNSSLPDSTVVYQSEKYGVRASNIDVLRIKVTRNEVEIGDMVGMTYEEARNYLINTLHVSNIDNCLIKGVNASSKEKEGIVYKQSASGVVSGDIVNSLVVYYYDEYKEVELKDLSEMSVEDCYSYLQELLGVSDPISYFKISTSSLDSSKFGRYVCKQSMSAGTYSLAEIKDNLVVYLYGCSHEHAEDDEGTITKEATCTSEGEIVYKCIHCEQEYTVSIAKKEHKFTVYVETIDATEESGGYDVYKCEDCDETTHLNLTDPLPKEDPEEPDPEETDSE